MISLYLVLAIDELFSLQCVVNLIRTFKDDIAHLLNSGIGKLWFEFLHELLNLSN